MSIEEAIRDRLLELTDVTAIVGTRIYLLKLPQRPTYPAVRLQPISEVRGYHMRGPDRMARTRIQVDAWASEGAVENPYASVTAAMAAIEGDGLGDGASGLAGFVGAIGTSPPVVHVAFCEALERRPLYDPDELRVVRMTQDFVVEWWAL